MVQIGSLFPELRMPKADINVKHDMYPKLTVFSGPGQKLKNCESVSEITERTFAMVAK